MIFYMVGKLAVNPTQFTRGLVKYVPGRGYFRAVPFQNGDKFATSPTPPIVERLENRTRQSKIIASKTKEPPLSQRIPTVALPKQGN